MAATSLFPDMKRLTLGCPRVTGTMKRNAGRRGRFQAPGGASRQQPAILAGILVLEEKRKSIEISDCARIARRHDAALIA